MAGVKPVEYIKDSSTAGFAVAGDQKPITDNNANTIKKDVDQGNTQKLDSGQTKYLEGKVDEDTIDYSNDEMKNVGKNQIDTKDTENSNGLQTAGSMVAASAGAASAGGVSSLGVGIQMDGYLTAAKEADKPAKIPFMAIVAGAIDLGVGTMALVAVNAFDDQYGNRMSQMNTAGDTNQTIQNYFDLMTSDMDTMLEDAEKYKDLSDTKLTGDVDRITQIGALQAQLSVYESQGNQEKVAELKAQIAELTQEGEEDPTVAMLGDLEKGLETYSGNSAEASGVAESGSTVAEFLGDGNKMGALGIVNTLLLTVSALMMLKSTSNAVITAAKVAWPFNSIAAVIAGIGAAMMLAGNIMVVAAAIKMGSKAKDEFQCADAGSEMQEYVNNLRSNVEQQTGFTESTGAEYITITTENAETTQKVKEGVDKANKNNPTQPAGSNPTTPTNGNGNGNGEKPEEPTAPEGAAA